ncbi:FRG domain-containing protein [Microbacterium aoyamense]|uniref:FRG domain-containing protein n=1 Tax=Microbacterium aoyamense TaxID=344166 RepID=A0ABN2Q4L4_9MICO|nr:FRG domain-containing protein [Microbacterium aoyamense]
MTLPAIDANRLFHEWQIDIDGWESFQAEVNHLTSTYETERFVWRGQSDASWGLQSSLHRAVSELQGRPATEDELVRAERNLLWRARVDWRMDGISSLPLLAQMQHVGVPTRLLDVTMNPLIAAWFATARNDKTDHKAARLLVFVDGNKPLQLNSLWNTNTPRWHQLKSDSARRHANWGTGLGRKIWRPPALHARIPAQSAAFILDGVPIDGADGGVHGDSIWTAGQLREFASVPMRLAHVRGGRLPNSFAPVFTYRISAEAKREIRHQLEERFGYRFSTVYADIEGLAQYARTWPEDALGDVTS